MEGVQKPQYKKENDRDRVVRQTETNVEHFLLSLASFCLRQKNNFRKLKLSADFFKTDFAITQISAYGRLQRVNNLIRGWLFS